MDTWKNFLKGVGSILNIRPSIHSEEMKKILNKTPQQALREDWEKIGQDFKTAMGYKNK